MWEVRTQRPNGMQRTRTQRTSHPQRSVRAADAQRSAAAFLLHWDIKGAPKCD
jgi:hypothetical protein